jgi:hypothetical protein
VGGGRPADRLGPTSESPTAHVAGLDELGDGADRLLDRDTRVEAGRAVDVDVIGAQSLQAEYATAVLTAAGRAS